MDVRKTTKGAPIIATIYRLALSSTRFHLG
jgi:hypothetical protein